VSLPHIAVGARSRLYARSASIDVDWARLTSLRGGVVAPDDKVSAWEGVLRDWMVRSRPFRLDVFDQEAAGGDTASQRTPSIIAIGAARRTGEATLGRIIDRYWQGTLCPYALLFDPAHDRALRSRVEECFPGVRSFVDDTALTGALAAVRHTLNEAQRSVPA
jgi:hypothetical protein